jgi:hypothetical protein
VVFTAVVSPPPSRTHTRSLAPNLSSPFLLSHLHTFFIHAFIPSCLSSPFFFALQVAAVLDAMSLKGQEHALVGSVEARGISGGQRKVRDG